MRIAFVGLGNMGRPMAENLGKAGHEVIGFDMAPVTLEHGTVMPLLAQAV